MASKDPLLHPFQLKHPTVKNRVMSTSHEQAYTEDRMPKRRYRLYQEERAKGGLALTMFGGSCVVAPDSPAAFGPLRRAIIDVDAPGPACFDLSLLPFEHAPGLAQPAEG